MNLQNVESRGNVRISQTAFASALTFPIACPHEAARTRNQYCPASAQKPHLLPSLTRRSRRSRSVASKNIANLSSHTFWVWEEVHRPWLSKSSNFLQNHQDLLPIRASHGCMDSLHSRDPTVQNYVGPESSQIRLVGGVQLCSFLQSGERGQLTGLSQHP